MAQFVRRFSVRSVLLTAAAIAVLLALAIPAYRRATAPVLTDQRSVIVKSNTVFPVVSTNVFFSGATSDRARILFLHRRTKETDGKWLPDWFEPKQTADGIPIRGLPVSFLVNGKPLYPRADSNLTVVYASDDDAPVVIRVSYSEYSMLRWNDTIMLWGKLVDDAA